MSPAGAGHVPGDLYICIRPETRINIQSPGKGWAAAKGAGGKTDRPTANSITSTF